MRDWFDDYFHVCVNGQKGRLKTVPFEFEDEAREIVAVK